MKTNKTLIYIVLIANLIFGVVQIARGLDMKIQHFEDGSGTITYCLPFDQAGPFWGGCN